MLPDALAREAQRIAHAGLDLDALCLAYDELLRRYVSYSAAAWATHDPATGLTTSCTLSGIARDPGRETMIFASEFDPDEPTTYLGMISARQDVGRLAEATGGDLSRADRWRQVFSRFGVSDELRAIVWWEERPWGSISLYRMDGRAFSDADAATVAGLSPLVADGIRVSLLHAAAHRPAAVQDPPGIIAVAPNGAVSALTRPAERWLEVGGEDLRTGARVVATALRQRDDWEGATSRVVAPDGTVLALHGSHTSTDTDDVAVIVEAARPAEVGAMLVDAYGLTPRQRDVLAQLLLGRSMTQIARTLGISEHTANDHRKAIYARTGVSSRSELAALLQHEAYDPHVAAGRSPSPYGGFLT